MKEYLRSALGRVLRTMKNVPTGFLPELSVPANPDHGDFATNCAMQLARHLRRSPRVIADEIVAAFMANGA